MRVANSYVGYEYDETKAYEKNGKMYVSARCKCDRCTKGVYVTRVENGRPVPHPAFGGVCLKCGGSGIITKEVRLYTDKEFEQMEKASIKATEKREAAREQKMKAEYANKRAKWLEENCFNENLTTFVYFPADSFEVKDSLKDAGFRFSKILLWHCANIPEGFEEKVVEIPLQEVGEISAWGEGFYKPEVKAIVKEIVASARTVEISNSEWVGEVGERLRDIPVTLVSIREIETKYGLTQLVRFIGENDEEFNWWTTAMIHAEVGSKIILAGTVKKHDEYNGTKITVLNRCKIKEI